jgi:outer membrane protein assembly factor BamA
MEQAPSITYTANIPKLIAKSDFSLLTNYDDVRWTYFFGIGNDTKFPSDKNIRYYTMRTRQWIIQPSLTRSFGRSAIHASVNLNGVKIINDTARFLAKEYYPGKSFYNWKTFANESLSYSYQKLNDPVVPTKGVSLNTTATASQGLSTDTHNYVDYAGTALFYIPLVSKFSLNLRTGAETITGQPEFYQYPSIGGTILRGFVRDRFRGKTVFWNTNDIRYISCVHTHIFVGKAGLQAFVDDGRVWTPGEASNTWHVAYGGGIILAPWNLVYADFNYGRSGKEHSVQVRVVFFLP